MNETKKDEYLIAVKVEENIEIFSFPTDKQRELFLKDIQKIEPDIEYMLTT